MEENGVQSACACHQSSCLDEIFFLSYVGRSTNLKHFCGQPNMHDCLVRTPEFADCTRFGVGRKPVDTITRISVRLRATARTSNCSKASELGLEKFLASCKNACDKHRTTYSSAEGFFGSLENRTYSFTQKNSSQIIPKGH